MSPCVDGASRWMNHQPQPWRGPVICWVEVMWAMGILQPSSHAAMSYVCDCALELHAEQKWFLLTVLELSCVMWALARNQCKHTSMMRLLVKKAAEQLDIFSLNTLALFLWSMTMLECRDDAFLTASTHQLLCVATDNDDPLDLSNILWALAHFRVAIRDDILEHVVQCIWKNEV